MKKFLILIIMSLILLVACNKQESIVQSNKELENAPDTSEVNINIPSTLLKEDVDLNNYAKENNFKSATKKEDGTVDITMTTKKYNELLKETSQTIEESFAKLVTDTNFLKDITHNKDFTEITMLVDKSIYNGSFDITPLSLYLNASMYQLIAQIESKCTVTIKDNSTNEIIKTINYPIAQ